MALFQSMHYIIWSVHPDLLNMGSLMIKWYGLCFLLAFLFSQKIGTYILQKEGFSYNECEKLTLYIILSTVIGARLGHFLFYDPMFFLKHPLEVILPVTFSPTFRFVGYQGLASHGAALGILITIYFYTRYDFTWEAFQISSHKNPVKRFLFLIDRLVIIVALSGFFIRIGNFFNAEIIGKPTNHPVGVFFAHPVIQSVLESSKAIQKVFLEKNTEGEIFKWNQHHYHPVTLVVDFYNYNFEEHEVRNLVEHTINYRLEIDCNTKEHLYKKPGGYLQYTLRKNGESYQARIMNLWSIPRHPSQIYEALSCLLLFCLLYFLWSRYRNKLRYGTLFSIFNLYVFGLRFLYEFLKENQVSFEEGRLLNMGQILSIPLIVLGTVILIYNACTKKQGPMNPFDEVMED